MNHYLSHFFVCLLQVHFGFSSGGQAGLLQSTEAYNDGEWHELSFKRVGLVGELLIDDKSVAAGQAGGNKSSISLIDPVYIGGLNPELIEKLDPKLQEQVMRNIGISQENIEVKSSFGSFFVYEANLFLRSF